MRTYLRDVLELLASSGFAPELFAVEDLAGGWKMVIVEYLSGDTGREASPRVTGRPLTHHS
jgi:hypothetical protein